MRPLAPALAEAMATATATATAMVPEDNSNLLNCTARTCKSVGRCRIRPRSVRLGTELGNALRCRGNTETCCGPMGTCPCRLLNRSIQQRFYSYYGCHKQDEEDEEKEAFVQ